MDGSLDCQNDSAPDVDSLLRRAAAALGAARVWRSRAPSAGEG
jgi:hypothetical protein